MAERKKNSKANAGNEESGASGSPREAPFRAGMAIQGELFTDPADAYALAKTVIKTKLPEIEPVEHSKGDALWNAFKALKDTGDSELDSFLNQLIALPEEEEISWNDVFRECAGWEAVDLSAVFRKISSSVPHTRDTQMGYFYWAAAEIFSKQKARYAHLLPEVAEGFIKMDVASYDADALLYTGLHLLDAGCADGALKLAEHFLPILRQDEGLTSWAVPEHCNHLFELRIGRELRDIAPGPHVSVGEIANNLRRDIEDEIHADPAQAAAAVIAGKTSALKWNRSLFDLVTGDITEDEEAWRDNIRLFATLVRVAQEAWCIDKEPPGRTLSGLFSLLKCVYETGSRTRKKNLLDHLHSDGLEERIAEQCPALIGVNEPQARILIDAFGILNRFAIRHDFISARIAEDMEREVARLREVLSDPVV